MPLSVSAAWEKAEQTTRLPWTLLECERRRPLIIEGKFREATVTQEWIRN